MLDLPNTKTRVAKVRSLPRCSADFGMRGRTIINSGKKDLARRGSEELVLLKPFAMDAMRACSR
jgi:hypothetical protein